jgi:DNA-binding MarR family transcriptional regulator
VAKRRRTTRPTPAWRLAQAAYALHTTLEAQLHEMLAELDLTMPLSDALWRLDPELGSLSRRELAARLRCDPSNVTFLVDRLENRRLVSRSRAVGDRRVTTLALTPAGIEVRNRLIATIALSSMFGALTRAEQAQLTDLLERCVGSGPP